MRAHSFDAVLQNAAAATGNGTALDTTGLATVGFQVSGTFSATVTFEATVDGTNWVSLQVQTIADGSVVTTATAAGLFVAAVAGLAQVRARISAYASGNVTVKALATAIGSGMTLADIDVAGTETVAVSSIAAGTTLIGKVSIDQVTANANEVVLKASSAAIGKLTTNSGVDIGDVDILTLPALEATTPAEYNITLTNANTEYSQALPANARRLCFRCRTGVQTRYAWVTGKVATPTVPYQTLVAGAEYALDGVLLAAATLYFASATAGAVIELEVVS